MSLLRQHIQVLQRSEQGMNINIVRDVIAKVCHRRRINRREPERLHTEPEQIVQLLRDTGKISNAVVVTILKTARVHLINDAGLPPGCSLYHISLYTATPRRSKYNTDSVKPIQSFRLIPLPSLRSDISSLRGAAWIKPARVGYPRVAI